MNPWRPKEAIRYQEADQRGWLVDQSGWWEPNTDTLQEQQVLLIVESCLWPSTLTFDLGLCACKLT